MTSDETLELLRSAVALRLEGRKVPESIRRALAHTEATLIGVIGPLVRKRVAAALLGCSVQALDRWIGKGMVPAEPIADGASRTALPTEAVIAIAYEFALLSDDASLGRAVEAWDVRRAREVEFITARNLTLFAHQIARASLERDAR